ncbi:methylenetetrahydrofolate dehydrogenase (NADP+) / methenyltetrahydrofolate cyclohydrolase [Marinitoga hydrogenitolerans DSM 16785]|uniref:Bifunctional protein FolD n=1 Tax=Marinitoga hydrogenitolerans (strain DSM 16785 / JCM 12826 / AT1271) TaxID=1122195 RepID=A0A1M4V7R6_MARH1|nr:bifunctional 5,10-methylenetetrahydrofolate dehydrogenase/5,10-methenyltetrahydrofolate cyclohydrolase [Marinitoga hydrogenitolerans]SHE65031.1 methylenetetrahydrofolate dehydrogenase (NADP+) / methenyltetrahydrofolate cyclohydrolase [Marinitoga hydrogenitolerans DSM 16785]
MIINIDNLAKKITENILKTSTKHKIKLTSVALNPEKPTLAYLNSQRKLAKKLHIDFDLIKLSSKNELLETIHILNNKNDVHGIFLAQPLPFDPFEIISKINPKKDIEGITPFNLGNLLYEKSYFKPCTADSVERILNDFTTLDGKKVTVIGRSVIVGRPVSILLSNSKNNATVTICHSHTKDLKEITLNSDIIVSAVGKADFITKEMVKKNTIIIDVGINFKNGELTGDVSPDVKEIAYVTEVPGGVGEITSLILFENLTKAL